MRTSILMVCCTSLWLVSGCGRDEKTISTPQGDIKITKNGGGATAEISSKDVKITTSGGAQNVAVPDNFPKDVPIIPGGAVKVAMTTKDGVSVHLIAPSSVADAAKYYQDNLKTQGWKVEPPQSAGPTTMLSATKDKRECAVMILNNTNGNGSVIQIMLQSKGG
jgi:hypothetical protein